jgi:alkanesulfonate monooxygenase SsuD/methylene tetrahydromethanopterin reductase-like flavin-dependent oxidoreductase (luciferase family)
MIDDARWGLCFGPAWGTSIAELIESARLAEARGFDRITIGEYHNDALTWMHALAGATSTVRVATTIVNIALRHPSVTAEAVAGIRDLHGDRIELGLGVSHSRIVGEQFGVELPRLGDLEEYTGAVRASLEGGSFAGRRWCVAPPLRRTRTCAGPVPILAAVLGERAAARAAAYADGLILTWTPHDQIARIGARAKLVARDTGRPAPARWLVLPCVPAASYERSLAAAAGHLRAYLELASYRRMLEEAGFAAQVETALQIVPDDETELAGALGAALLSQVALLGGRDGIRDVFGGTVEQLRALGVTDVILYPLDSGEGWRAALERTLDELAPAA